MDQALVTMACSIRRSNRATFETAFVRAGKRLIGDIQGLKSVAREEHMVFGVEYLFERGQHPDHPAFCLGLRTDISLVAPDKFSAMQTAISNGFNDFSVSSQKIGETMFAPDFKGLYVGVSATYVLDSINVSSCVPIDNFQKVFLLSCYLQPAGNEAYLRLLRFSSPSGYYDGHPCRPDNFDNWAPATVKNISQTLGGNPCAVLWGKIPNVPANHPEMAQLIILWSETPEISVAKYEAGLGRIVTTVARRGHYTKLSRTPDDLAHWIMDELAFDSGRLGKVFPTDLYTL